MPNCGCPAGQKCYTNTTTTPSFTRECTAAGSGTSSSLCTSEAGCAIGTQCIELFGESTSPESMCYAFCNSETDCPTDASVCLSFFTTETYPKVCSHACNPISNSGCPSGTKCQLLTLTTSGTDLTDCTADMGYVSAGGYCAAEEDCSAGTFCAVSINECIAMCTYSSGPECTGFEICNLFQDEYGTDVMITLDGVSYGYCR
ncbi:MAG: hypothetical protein JRG91_09705 [Deltaproteobacteria bacterium]|nr:hypothetical protein [Deltaproteobacteria bacterium]